MTMMASPAIPSCATMPQSIGLSLDDGHARGRADVFAAEGALVIVEALRGAREYDEAGVEDRGLVVHVAEEGLRAAGREVPDLHVRARRVGGEDEGVGLRTDVGHRRGRNFRIEVRPERI